MARALWRRLLTRSLPNYNDSEGRAQVWDKACDLWWSLLCRVCLDQWCFYQHHGFKKLQWISKDFNIWLTQSYICYLFDDNFGCIERSLHEKQPRLTDQIYTFPLDSINKCGSNVITVVQDSMGMDQTEDSE